MAFPLSSVNMSPSAPSRRLSSFYYFLDLNMLFRIPFHFLWNLSQFHFCFKLTGNFLRCINYYFVIILAYILLLPSFYMFSCSVASSLGSCIDFFQVSQHFLLHQDHLQSYGPKSICDSLSFLLWHLHLIDI